MVASQELCEHTRVIRQDICPVRCPQSCTKVYERVYLRWYRILRIYANGITRLTLRCETRCYDIDLPTSWGGRFTRIVRRRCQIPETVEGESLRLKIDVVLVYNRTTRKERNDTLVCAQEWTLKDRAILCRQIDKNGQIPVNPVWLRRISPYGSNVRLYVCYRIQVVTILQSWQKIDVFLNLTDDLTVARSISLYNHFLFKVG